MKTSTIITVIFCTLLFPLILVVAIGICVPPWSLVKMLCSPDWGNTP